MRIEDTVKVMIKKECEDAGVPAASHPINRLLDRYAAKEIRSNRLTSVLQEIYELLKEEERAR